MRKILFWVCLGIISIILMVLSSEGLLRCAGKKPFHVNSAQNNFWKYDSLLGWRNQPGQQGIFEKPPVFRTKVSINSKGLRDKEYPYERVPGKRRILVLGDSYAWGFGVEQREIFTEVLENMFDDVEVINSGVSGYGNDQELLWFQTEGVRYKPDLVMVVVCGNDLYENSYEFVNDLYHKPRFRLDSLGGLHLQGVPVPPVPLINNMYLALRQHSAFFSYLNFLFTSLWYNHIRKMNHPASFRLTFALLAEIRKSAGRFMIVAGDGFWDTREKYADFIHDLKAKGFSVLDVTSCSGYDGVRMKLPEDSHWNVSGHRFVAREIFNYIGDHGLLKVDSAIVNR
jgi:hypothetical protein